MPRVPTHRPPTPPGEVLAEEFLGPLGLTQRQVADAIGVPYQRLNAVVRGRRAVSPSTALRLGRYFGTSAAFWLDLQLRADLYEAARGEAEALAAIEPLAA